MLLPSDDLPPLEHPLLDDKIRVAIFTALDNPAAANCDDDDES